MKEMHGDKMIISTAELIKFDEELKIPREPFEERRHEITELMNALGALHNIDFNEVFYQYMLWKKDMYIFGLTD